MTVQSLASHPLMRHRFLTCSTCLSPVRVCPCPCKLFLFELTADLHDCLLQLYSCQGFPQLMVRPGTLWVHVAAQVATEQHRILHHHWQPAERGNLCCLLVQTIDFRSSSPQHSTYSCTPCSQLKLTYCNAVNSSSACALLHAISTTTPCLRFCSDCYKNMS